MGSAPPPRERSSVLFDDDVIDEALDSFKTLFCARCHVYDCVLHGCGQIDRAARAYEPAVAERGAFGRPKAPKSGRKRKRKERGRLARSPPRPTIRTPRTTASRRAAAVRAVVLAAERRSGDARRPRVRPGLRASRSRGAIALGAALARASRAGWSPERTRWFEDFFATAPLRRTAA